MLCSGYSNDIPDSLILGWVSGLFLIYKFLFKRRMLLCKRHLVNFYNQIFFILSEGFNLAQMPFSAGRHQWDVNLVQIQKFQWVRVHRF